jgi:Nucleotidyl transferase AbiEii toxin, Type IV TA system
VNLETKLLVARIVLDVCRQRGYHLAGSLALHAHGVAGARESDDIDLFTDRILDADVVRAAVCAAVRAAGFSVEVTRTRAFHPRVGSDQNADLRVSHPSLGEVTVQMARMPRYFESVQAAGMPVAALGELLYSKVEAPGTRVAAKDYIDLAVLTRHLGQEAVDSYLADYVAGIAEARRVAAVQVALQLYQSLAQAAEVPDQAFTGYGLDGLLAAQARAALLVWADRVLPAQRNEQRIAPRIGAGVEGLAREVAMASLLRVSGMGRLALLTNPQLSSVRGTAVAEAAAARRVVEELTRTTGQGQAPSEELAEQIRRSAELAEQVVRITMELQRRIRLTEQQRAQEVAVRRAIAGERADGRPVELADAARLTSAPTPARRRRHAEAEEEWQHHRPVQGSVNAGVTR